MWVLASIMKPGDYQILHLKSMTCEHMAFCAAYWSKSPTVVDFSGDIFWCSGCCRSSDSLWTCCIWLKTDITISGHFYFVIITLHAYWPLCSCRHITTYPQRELCVLQSSNTSLWIIPYALMSSKVVISLRYYWRHCSAVHCSLRKQVDDQKLEEKEPSSAPLSIDWCEGLELPQWVVPADGDERWVSCTMLCFVSAAASVEQLLCSLDITESFYFSLYYCMQLSYAKSICFYVEFCWKIRTCF
jgi:hypothetical protein